MALLVKNSGEELWSETDILLGRVNAGLDQGMKILPVENRARLARAIDNIKPVSGNADEENEDPVSDMNFDSLSATPGDDSAELTEQKQRSKESIIRTVSDQCHMLYKLIRPLNHAYMRWEWGQEQEREQGRMAKEADQKLAELSTVPAKTFLTDAVEVVNVLIPRLSEHVGVEDSEVLPEIRLARASSPTPPAPEATQPELPSPRVIPPLEKETREFLKKLESFMNNAGADLEGDLAQRNPQAHQAVVFILEHMTYVLSKSPFSVQVFTFQEILMR